MEQESTKKCKRCGEVKSLSAFEFRNDNKKFRSECKSCQNKQKQSRPNYKKLKKASYMRNKNTAIVYRKKHEDKTKSDHFKWSRTPEGKWSCLNRVARKTNRTVNITFEEYKTLTRETCHYCPRTLQNDTGYSLNRLNNDSDYSINNVVPCCKFCNKMMNNFSKSDIIISARGILRVLEAQDDNDE